MSYVFTQMGKYLSLAFIFLFSMMAIQLGRGQQLEKTSLVKTEYLINLPVNYDKNRSKKWPLMIYLHGGLQSPTIDGLKQDFLPYQMNHGMELPFIVVSPLCNTGLWNVGILNFLLEDVLAAYRVDEDKVFLTGHSLGGYGTWEWAFDNPEKFAAIVPVSGCSNEEDRKIAWKLRNTPIWLFHGDTDEVVEIDCNVEIAQSLENYGGNLKFTKYRNTGHDTWEQTYRNKDLYQWLLRQDRNKNVPKKIQLKENTLKRYQGNYTLDGDTLSISPDNGQLKVSMGQGHSRKLLAESETIFSFEKNPFGGILFTIERGKVSGFKLLTAMQKFAVKIE